MALSKSIFLSHINNLNDARLAAGMGVAYLGIAIETHHPQHLPPSMFKEIAPWVVGPAFVGQYYGQSAQQAHTLSAQYVADQQGVEHTLAGMEINNHALAEQLTEQWNTHTSIPNPANPVVPKYKLFVRHPLPTTQTTNHIGIPIVESSVEQTLHHWSALCTWAQQQSIFISPFTSSPGSSNGSSNGSSDGLEQLLAQLLDSPIQGMVVYGTQMGYDFQDILARLETDD